MRPDVGLDRRQLPLVGPLERALYLRSLAMFADLGPRELSAMAQLMTERRLPRGTVLYEAGQPSTCVYLLVEGSVRHERDGRTLTVHHAPDGVGLLSLLADDQSGPRGIADSDLVALVIDGSVFLDLTEDYPALFDHTRRTLGRQLARLQIRHGALHSGPRRTALDPAPIDRPLSLLDRLLWLRQSPAFDGLGLGTLAGLVDDEQDLRAEVGDVLWRRGDPPAFFCVLTAGTVRGEVEGASFEAGPGVALGVDAAFAEIPHTYTCTVRDPVLALRIDTHAFADVLEDHPALGRRGLQYLAREILRLSAAGMAS